MTDDLPGCLIALRDQLETLKRYQMLSHEGVVAMLPDGDVINADPELWIRWSDLDVLLTALSLPQRSEKKEDKNMARVDDHGCVPEPGTTANIANGDAPTFLRGAFKCAVCGTSLMNMVFVLGSNFKCPSCAGISLPDDAETP